MKVPTNEAIIDGVKKEVVEDTVVANAPVVEPLEDDALKGVEVELKRLPLKVDGKPLRSIRVPVKQTKDLKALGERSMADVSMTNIVSAYCDVDIAIINAMHPDDFDDLRKAVFDFLPRFMREALTDYQEKVREAVQEDQEKKATGSA